MLHEAREARERAPQEGDCWRTEACLRINGIAQRIFHALSYMRQIIKAHHGR